VARALGEDGDWIPSFQHGLERAHGAAVGGAALDRRDRADGPLGRATRPEDAAPDAVVIDSSDVTADEVIADLLARAEKVFG
jgi:cytidylate kinase